MKTIKFLLIFIFFLSARISPFSQNILKDLTEDHTITITILNNGKDATSDVIDTSDDLTFGNKWYSKNTFLIKNSTDTGFSGSKDYLNEYFLTKFKFKSRNKHAFSIKIDHIGFTKGLYSNNFEFYDFGIMGGFEYLYKIFNNISGIFFWTAIGACQKGPAFNLGIGIGSDSENSFQLNFSYLHNVLLLSKMEFYFLILKFITFKGKLGIIIHLNDFAIDFFNFFNGFYFGFFIKKVFKIELGGGFTFNDYGYFSGFGGIDLLIRI
ncbi:MAG: hypothetical protein JXB50_06055 [Spirochaetes bacterium]|nr:hypothetical protein [Spirochaetota bacterium]